jgi:hypothetical protein
LASWVISAILFFSEMAPGTKALLIFIDTIIVSDIFLNYTSMTIEAHFSIPPMKGWKGM